MALVKVFAAVFLFATLLQLGQSLQCYQCSPDTTPCTDPLTDDMLVNCTEGLNVCYKLVSEISDGSVTVGGVARRCGASIAECALLSIDTDVISNECYSCIEDGCNSAVTISSALGLSAILAAVVVLRNHS